jgi:hypothetical protein
MTDQDVFAYQKEVWSRSEVTGFDELVDMTAVTAIEFVSGERIQILAAFSAMMDAPGSASRLAIVAPYDYHFGLGRMYQAYRDAQPRSTKQIGVFRSREEALVWLGIKKVAEP